MLDTKRREEINEDRQKKWIKVILVSMFIMCAVLTNIFVFHTQKAYADSGLYLTEGDYADAAISAACAIPFVKEGVLGVDIAKMVLEDGSEIVRAVNEAEDIGKLAEGAGNAWKGSGPVPGVLGANPASESVGALKNYYPKNGNIDYVFDPNTNTFVTGAPKSGMFTGSPHQQLAQTIGADESSVVSGMFSRGAYGEIITNESSGHYWQKWIQEVRKQFESVMENYGLPVIHYEGK